MAGGRQQSWISLKAAGGGLEWASAFFQGLAFSPHRHDSYAIGITTHGIQAFTYRGAGRQSCVGDAFVLHPDELHDGRQGSDAGYGYRILYLSPALVAEALDGGALPFVSEAVSRDPCLRRAVAEAFPDAREAADDLQQVATITALADSLRRLAGQPGKRRGALNLPLMKRVREHLLAVAPATVGMAVLEQTHGLDGYALSRQFRRAFGVSPHRFVTLRRLDLAKRHIQQDQSLANAALLAGFADQSHMTRQFRRAFGLPPGTWKRLLN